MVFDANDNENDYEFGCPECGSGNIVVEEDMGSYYIAHCKKCGYNSPRNRIKNS